MTAAGLALVLRRQRRDNYKPFKAPRRPHLAHLLCNALEPLQPASLDRADLKRNKAKQKKTATPVPRAPSASGKVELPYSPL